MTLLRPVALRGEVFCVWPLIGLAFQPWQTFWQTMASPRADTKWSEGASLAPGSQYKCTETYRITTAVVFQMIEQERDSGKTVEQQHRFKPSGPCS